MQPEIMFGKNNNKTKTRYFTNINVPTNATVILCPLTTFPPKLTAIKRHNSGLLLRPNYNSNSSAYQALS